MWPNACGSAGASWSSGRVSISRLESRQPTVGSDRLESPLIRATSRITPATGIPQHRQQRLIDKCKFRAPEGCTGCSEKHANSGSGPKRITTPQVYLNGPRQTWAPPAW
jgi:hypothetical protein